MPSWPSDAPAKFLIDGYRRDPIDTVLRSETDTGPGKRRNRSTLQRHNIAGAMAATDAQKVAIETFYTTTLVRGALSFDWVHPETGSACTMLFRDPPGFSPRGGGSRWTVSLALEMRL